MSTLITGASSGVGEALALACAKRGDRLFLCGRNAERLVAVAEACRKIGATVSEQVLDVADEEATRRWLNACDEESPLDRVFANAGVSTGEETETNSRRTFAINVGGCVNTVLPAIELFRKRRPSDGGKIPGSPQIVITASIAGYGPLKACPAYSATKSCVKTWGLALRGMLAPEGIRVSVVCPGFIRTRLTEGNTCPMPFLMDADKAANIILRRADRNVGVIAFPLPMRLGAWWISVLHWRINEFINRLLPKKVL